MRRDHPPLTLPSAGGFLWATGIEDTFIVAPHRTTGRILDEYALTEHYTRWEEDLRLVAELGVSAVRYGIPWYRVNPRPGEYDWEWTDRALERLVLTHRIEPILDLVHYGTPSWLENAFLHPDYPQVVAEYAHAFATRYQGLCTWYTPLNEPRVNAWYAGRLGWWPPYARSWRGFAQVLVQLCRGICRTQQAIEAAEPHAIFVHVDATDLYLPADRNDPELTAQAQLRQAFVFLALDLVMGRVDGSHALREWLGKHGFTEDDLGWFHRNAVQPDVIGYNMYPMFSRKLVTRTSAGRLRVKITPCWAETLVTLTEMYAARYAPLPVMVTETASNGTMPRRVRWINESITALRTLQESGVPVIGYTFWPLFSLVAWAYQAGKGDLHTYLVDMGLWDLKPGPAGLERVQTPAVSAFKHQIALAEPYEVGT